MSGKGARARLSLTGKSALRLLMSISHYRLALSFMAAVCLFAILPIPTSLYAMGVDALLFSGTRWYLQQLAKYDPLAMQVYLRHIRWPAWLPAHGKILKTRRRLKVFERT